MRYYSTTAGEMILQAGIGSGDTTIEVDTTSGLPVTYPYTLLLDYGESSEEVVDVTNASGTTLTVTRGVDGTVAQAHSFGAVIRHAVTARDFRESREHEAATGAHGVTEVVGTTEAQVLDNKTFEPDGDHQALIVTTRSGATEPALEVQSPTGVKIASVDEFSTRSYDGSNVLAQTYHSTAANFFKRIFNLRVASDIHALTGDVTGSPTGRFIRLLSGASELFYVAATGFAKMTGAQVDGNLTVNGDLSVTGTVPTDSALTARVTTAEADIVALEGNVTTLTAADTALDTRVDALEAVSWGSLTQTSAQSIPNNSATTVNFHASDGTGVTRSTVSDSFTITTAGVYVITAAVGYAASSSGRREARILVDGVQVARASVPATSSSNTVATVTWIGNLAVSDAVTLQAAQDSGAARDTDETLTYLQLARVA